MKLQTTDRTFAAYLILIGHELAEPVNYNGPQWIYVFDTDEEEWYQQRDCFRRSGLNDFHKICVALVIAGKGHEIKAPILAEWPALKMAVKEVVS